MQATVKMSVAYTDLEGKPAILNPGPILCQYKDISSGEIQVPDQSPLGTEFDVSFQGLLCGANLVVIENRTNQELNCAWGGNWAPHLAPGACTLVAMPAMPAAGQMTALRFMLTQQQSGDGCIVFYAFGS